MKERILGSLILFIIGFSCVRADNDSDALEKLRKLPQAPADEYQIDEDKLTPLLVVKARGVFINESQTPVPFDQVLVALAALPQKAWPYGRVIEYFPGPFGITQPKDRPSVADVKKVEAKLKAAGIVLRFGTSD
jgi:hypothetical protein